MAEYTTEVRSICEFYAGLKESVGQNQVIQIIERSRDKIFNFPYPMFDENYKSVLESKILSHYYTREISEETVGLWQLRLYSKMNEIMPKYNKLYELEAKKINPLATIWKETQGNKKGNKEETDDRSIKNNTESNRNSVTGETIREDKGKTSTSNEAVANSGNDITSTDNERSFIGYKEHDVNVDKYSETPQSQADLLDEGYLTNARAVDNTKTYEGIIKDHTNEGVTHGLRTDTTSNDTESTQSNIGKTGTTDDKNTSTSTTADSNVNKANTTDEYIEQITGFDGVSYTKLVKEFRDNFMNIDLMIIDELKDLFFQLW